MKDIEQIRLYNKSNFKRDDYYKIENIILHGECNIIFLLGPRKCGKTFILMQLSQNQKLSTKFFDFKTCVEDKSISIIDGVVDSILSGEEITYLLDETTYMYFPEQEIARIAQAYTEAKVCNITIKTKVVFTGSQSIALSAWGHRAFAHQANYIYMEFLSYSEWLRYIGTKDISRDSYLQYIYGIFSFYKDFESIKEYLQSCLDETVVSNSKSRNIIYGNNCDLVNIESLISLLYIMLFKLHDVSSASNIFKSGSFEDKLVYVSRINKMYLDRSDVHEKLSKSFLYRYDHVKAMDLDSLKQSLAFLIRCDLITATPVFSDFDHTLDVLRNLESDDGVFQKKSDIFGKVNFTINYPMFYVAVLKEVFGDGLPSELDGYTLGSIVECQVRGLLPSESAFEYHDIAENEIDYINILAHLAVEITITNKDMKSDVHFDLLPDTDNYVQVLLTKDVYKQQGNLILCPYYIAIYALTGIDKSLDVFLQNITKLNNI